MGGCSDDGFEYFRYWLITRGQEVFNSTMENVDSLCDEFDKLANGDIPEFEDIAYIPKHILEDKYGKDFYSEEENYDFEDVARPDIVLDWDEEDEDSMRKICPKTFDKWWDSDKF